MRPPKLNHTTEGLVEVIGHHIPYEIRMMRQTFVMLENGLMPLWFGQTVVNALIESFCLHARSLIEFFSGNATPSGGMAAAIHFAKPGYEPCPEESPNRDLKGKLNAQIAHPSYSRTSNDKDKISPADRATLMNFIDAEVVRLSKEMKEIYKPHWPDDMTTQSVIAALQVNGLAPASTSSQVVAITGPTGPVGPSSAGVQEFLYSTDPKRRP